LNLLESIQVGIKDLWLRKIRSLITMIGIILGTMSIIAVLSLVQGGKERSINFMKERGGVLKMSVYPREEFELDIKDSQRYKKYLTIEDIEYIKRKVPEIHYFNPQIRKGLDIIYKDRKYNHSLNGIFTDYQYVEEFYVDKGRFITSLDNKKANNVIVLGTSAKKELFGNENAIGKKVIIKGQTFEVVGIMEKKEFYFGGFGHNALEWMNRWNYIPYKTMVKKLINEEAIWDFNFKLDNLEDVMPVKEKVEQILTNRRYGKNLFEVRTNQERLEEIQKSSAQFQIIFLLVGGISLIVGGIVIMNIMFASIGERTREIGIRTAVGARRRDILMQFLVQTVLISAIGGIIGILLGLSLLGFLAKFLSSPTAVSSSMIYIALFCSSGIGIIFGIIPAIRASRLDPVKALRYE